VTASDATIATTTPATGRAWMGVVVLLAVVAAAFANAIDNGFVYDDQILVVDDPAVRLPLSAGGEGLHYRPLRTLSYRLDHAIGGLDPRVFHLTNVAYHAGTVLLVATLLARLGTSPGATIFGALVFAVHPVQTDAVTYVSGRRDVVCGLFYVLGVLAYLRHRRDGGAGALVLAFVAYVLAILAKEMAVTMPVACLLADRWLARRGVTSRAAVRVGRRELMLVAGLLLAGALALAATYGGHIVLLATERPWHGGSVATNVATMVRVWAKYAQLVVWPGTLSADYSYDAFPVSLTILDPRALAAAVVLAGIAAVAWRSWHRGGAAGLGLAWAAVALLPVSHLIPFRELLAEHYLYVPMVGVALCAAGIADGALGAWPSRRGWITAAGCGIVAALMARTIVRNDDWQDRLTLWTATVAVVPRCARAHFNLGQAYFERSRLAEAERAWLAAAALQPDDRAIGRALAALDQRLGRWDLATTKVEALLAAEPKDAETLVLAGGLSLDRGRPEKAREYFDAALAILPPDRAARARDGREQALRAAARPPSPATGLPLGRGPR
jgi:hypothetical protein